MSTPRIAEVFPAGEHLAEELEARGWAQADFAEILGRPAQFVSEVISGKKEVTRESAAQIAAALGTSPEFWLNLQDTYLLWQQAQDEGTRANLNVVKTRAKLREVAPVSLLVKRGFISDSDPETQKRELLELLDLESFEDGRSIGVAARRSNGDEAVNVMQRAWVACVRATAQRLTVANYSETALKKLAGELSGKARDPESVAGFQELFAAAGVKLVYVEGFPGGKFDGCAFMLEERPVIGISGRWKRLDKVLFTILHEIAHVLLGHVPIGGEPIVDDFSQARLPTEEKADELAASLAISGPLPVVPVRPSASWIAAAAERLHVHPIVLIGRLQSDSQLSWKTTLVRDAPTVIDQLERWTGRGHSAS